MAMDGSAGVEDTSQGQTTATPPLAVPHSPTARSDPDASADDELSLIPLQDDYRTDSRTSSLRHRTAASVAASSPAPREATSRPRSTVAGHWRLPLPSHGSPDPGISSRHAAQGLSNWSSISSSAASDDHLNGFEHSRRAGGGASGNHDLPRGSRLRATPLLCRPTMTSALVSWASRHKRAATLALVALSLYVQLQLVGPYISQLDSYRSIKESDWQSWRWNPPDHSSSRPGAASAGPASDVAPSPAAPSAAGSAPASASASPYPIPGSSDGSNLVSSSDPRLGANISFQVQPVTPAVFPAALDPTAFSADVDVASQLYADFDPHRGELPTHLRGVLEREPVLVPPPQPPKAPKIKPEMWPKRAWYARSNSTMRDAQRPERQPVEEDWRPPPWDSWRPPLAELGAASRGRPLPKVQHAFTDPRKHSGHRNDPARDELNAYRQRLVRNAFLHAWEGYKKHAWGHDELRPVSKRAQDNFNGWGATIVDALDTLLVMDLPDQYDLARQHVRDIDFTLVAGDRSAYGAADGRIPVFETAIRYLGGFLSAYDLSGDTLMRDRAEELAQLILPAFDTATGVPVGRIKMPKPFASSSTSEPEVERPYAPPRQQGSVVLAEAGSMLLEFTRLWQVTGNRTYFDRVQRSTDWLDHNMTRDGRPGTLLSTTLYPDRRTLYGSYRFGGMADSYYEYLIKEHQLLGGKLPQYPRMYGDAIDSAKFFLMQEVDTVPGVRLLNIGERSYGRFTSKLEHLTCFSGGMLGLGARLMPERRGDVDLATAFTETCYWAYNSSATGLGPEHLVFYASDDSSRFHLISLEDGTQRRGKARGSPLVGVSSSAGHYLNRPETIESVFYMWRITGDVQWQERGWQMFASWVYHAMTDAGFSAIHDVHSVPADWTDSMESFTFAETFKYYYLLFSPPELVSLDEYVFTTEAHPLLAPKKGQWAVPGQGSRRFWNGPRQAAAQAAGNDGDGSAAYSGGEGGEYGGLTNNQKHAVYDIWRQKNAKVVVASSLIETLGADALKSTLKGLLGGVDWDKLVPTRGGGGKSGSDVAGGATARSDDGEAPTCDAEHPCDGDAQLGEGIGELPAGAQLIEFADGTFALDLGEGESDFRLKLLAAAAAAASRQAENGGESEAQVAGAAASTPPSSSLSGSRRPLTAKEEEEEEEAAEVHRLNQMQAARFRSKGLVAPDRSKGQKRRLDSQ
ncbi:uncharacterized protein PFL1_01246 [Pseudozyma flocculosa PF-1]|uniref:alpha-1,2-Mannosidase n=1 Tax=Pseudozyma flocculosa TaxID=84751 RepID=A0A5C3EU73_9BASI|nr:uncharacterized protein PFL1_01246 [Pseudozyma flocculosa PF-1]EPQ31057.1 hypothetical protein PFL1_01246 [Pseudozyma flocculosa PF-1]SPO35904.1 related to Mannosyl-oligosaccharide 1,2-alpha-mannosidase IC [Pseudozyma flocculosa]